MQFRELSWCFPVFQQIDIDEATGSTGIIIRLFGITQVRRFPTFKPLSNVVYNRQDIVC